MPQAASAKARFGMPPVRQQAGLPDCKDSRPDSCLDTFCHEPEGCAGAPFRPRDQLPGPSLGRRSDLPSMRLGCREQRLMTHNKQSQQIAAHTASIPDWIRSDEPAKPEGEAEKEVGPLIGKAECRADKGTTAASGAKRRAVRPAGGSACRPTISTETAGAIASLRHPPQPSQACHALAFGKPSRRRHATSVGYRRKPSEQPALQQAHPDELHARR